MNAEELKDQFKNAPEWAFFGLAKRVEALEIEIAELKKPKKRVTKKKVRNGNN